VAAAVAHERNIFGATRCFERMPQRISPLLHHAVSLNRYAAEIGKPTANAWKQFTDANFPRCGSKSSLRRRFTPNSRKPC